MTSSAVEQSKSALSDRQKLAEYECRGFEYGVIHWRSKMTGVLQKQIEQSLGISATGLKSLLELGAIYKDHQRLENWETLLTPQPAGTYLRLHSRPRRFQVPPDLSSRVIFANSDFLVLDKPAGVPCHPTVDNKIENLVVACQQKFNTPLFVTHRLDVGTQGLLVFAKNKLFQAEFNQLLKKSLVQKTYLAEVENISALKQKILPGQILRHWMEPSPRAPKQLSSTAQVGWAECLLLLKEFISESQIELKLLTGRTHQIRAQLGYIGHPLKGDALYGSQQAEAFSLISHSLQFNEFSFQRPSRDHDAHILPNTL